MSRRPLIASLSIAIRELARAIHLVDPYDRGDLDELRASLDRVLELWGKRSTPLSKGPRRYQKAQSGLSLALLELLGIRKQVHDNHPPARIATAKTLTLNLLTKTIDELGGEVVNRPTVGETTPVAPTADAGDVQLEIAEAGREADLVSVPVMSRWRDRSTGEVWQICGAESTESGTDARVELWQGVGTKTTSTTWRKLVSTHDQVER